MSVSPVFGGLAPITIGATNGNLEVGGGFRKCFREVKFIVSLNLKINLFRSESSLKILKLELCYYVFVGFVYIPKFLI